MEILLLSQNRVIIEFIKIASSRLNAKLEIKKELNNLPKRAFDSVIIDEYFSILPCEEIAEKIKHKKVILLTSDENSKCEFIVKKPFLPNDIVDILKSNTILNTKEVSLIKEFLEEDSNKTKLTTNIDSFLEVLFYLGPQTLKKLLQDATITIDFKGDKE
jgi:hypothetical protein